jgi:hypothetical protein
MQEEISLVWKYLLPAIHDDEVPADKKSLSELKEKLALLSLPQPVKSNASPTEKNISGKSFSLDANEKKIKAIFF